MPTEFADLDAPREGREDGRKDAATQTEQECGGWDAAPVSWRPLSQLDVCNVHPNGIDWSDLAGVAEGARHVSWWMENRRHAPLEGGYVANAGQFQEDLRQLHDSLDKLLSMLDKEYEQHEHEIVKSGPRMYHRKPRPRSRDR